MEELQIIRLYFNFNYSHLTSDLKLTPFKFLHDVISGTLIFNLGIGNYTARSTSIWCKTALPKTNIKLKLNV